MIVIVHYCCHRAPRSITFVMKLMILRRAAGAPMSAPAAAGVCVNTRGSLLLMDLPRINFLEHLEETDAASWNSLAGLEYPFLRYEYLHALETSGSVSAASGWKPCHLTARRGGKLVALMPMYRKSHSWGEYVFDWSWAQAYQQHGLRYYPKLVSAIPFTPCQGPRLLRQDDAPSAAELLAAVRDYAVEQQCSSWHLLFPDQESEQSLEAQPLLKRLGVQFHWRNPGGCTSFEQLLGLFTSRRRKNIRREREKVAAQGFSFRWLEGAQISEAMLERFYVFYQATYLKRGQRGYLSREFFEQLLTRMPEQIMLIAAERAGATVAAAWFFKGGGTLYGRYWGCLEEFDHLHFETCYYQGLDYCLAHGLPHFDAGAQGEHKLLRGFQPHYTSSYHWLAEPAFEAAVADFLAQERRQVARYLEEAQAVLPYRRSDQEGA